MTAPAAAAAPRPGSLVIGPPIALPASHFAAAHLFLLLGMAGALRAAPWLAQGAYVAMPVVAVTHLFTLGWITTSIMGALYQFLPVALARNIRWTGLAWITGVLHVSGLATFVAGLATWRPGVAFVGASLLAVALTCFAINLIATLRRPVRRDLTWWALAGAALFLCITLVLGGILAGNLRWGYLGGTRLLVLVTHLTVALTGWVLLVVIGVSHRLLPMFLLSHGAGERVARYALGLVAAGAAVLAIGHHFQVIRDLLAPALLTAGVLAFAWQARRLYAHRRRRALDAGLRLAALAISVLSLAVMLGLLAHLLPGSPRLAITAVVATVLGIALYVAGFHYKILPFLVWHHFFGPLAGKRELPAVADLYRHDVASTATLLLFGGAVAAIVGVAAAQATIVTGGAALFVAGAALMSGQMIAVARRRP